ncbi:MAG: 60Kd inner membrane protein-domain-containing protein [Monoraphidium minutum]|nr:MAG: 60Kd inner membrane protein-domain-containing protein [Monoraphidium minutum]
MPWWEAIIVSNLVVRLATFPITVFTQRKSGRMTELRAHSQHMQSLYAQASKVTSLAEYERLQAQIRGAQEQLRSKYGKDAKWALLMPGIALANMAVFISQFSAISTLANEGLPSMVHEGLLWFGDLTAPDPVYGLPVLCAALTLAMVESGAMGAEMGQASTAAGLKWLMRGLALVFIPAGHYVPAAVGLLWFSNSLFSLGQAAALRNNALRARFGLPDMASVAAAAAAASAGPPSPLVAKMQQLLGHEPAAGGGSGGAGAAGGADAAGGAAAAKGAAAPPPPGTRPSRLVTQKPPGWKHRKS